MVTTGSSKEISRIDARGRVGGARPLFAAASMFALALPLIAGCSRGGYPGGHSDAAVRDAQGPPQDASPRDLVAANLDGAADLRLPADFAGLPDFAAPPDFAVPPDLGTPPDFAAPSDLTTGTITGGPCRSGASGATALRVYWTQSGTRAQVNYDVHGLPDKSLWKVEVNGFVIGFTPQWADPFLGPGGLQLDGSDFIDVKFSAVGVHNINSVTVALFGRSYATTASGSFSWQTRAGIGATATNSMSNATPYRWYPGDATGYFDPDEAGILLRVKAGGGSGSVVVNQLELCIDAS